MKQSNANVMNIRMLVAGAAFSVITSLLLTACNKEAGYTDNNQDPPSGVGASVMAVAGDSATILGTVNQFRKLLGDSLNTTPGKTGGRREVNWDAVPAKFTNNNTFPAAFFNSTVATDPAGRKRGIVMGASTAFRVDSTDFSEVDASYATQFDVFSKNRLFANLASNVTTATFQVPGTPTEAFVNGFGVIFSDVDNDHSTTIEFFSGNKSLGIFDVPAHPASGTFSFLGVHFANAKVTNIKITCGNGVLAGGTKDVSDGGTKDLVVMDDFFYNEPAGIQ